MALSKKAKTYFLTQYLLCHIKEKIWHRRGDKWKLDSKFQKAVQLYAALVLNQGLEPAANISDLWDDKRDDVDHGISITF